MDLSWKPKPPSAVVAEQILNTFQAVVAAAQNVIVSQGRLVAAAIIRHAVIVPAQMFVLGSVVIRARIRVVMGRDALTIPDVLGTVTLRNAMGDVINFL